MLKKYLEPMASQLPQPEIRQGESWDHQVEGYHFVRGIYNSAHTQNAGAGLFFDMGTGKTRTAIHLLDNSRFVKKVLIVTPKKVRAVWPEQFEEHSPLRNVRRVLVPAGKSVRDRAMEIADAVEDFDARISMKQLAITINYETAWREPMKTTLQHCGFQMIILDEAHRLKAPGSRTSRYFEKLGRMIPYRLALTGTPLPHSPLDIWAMYRFLDPSVFPRYLCWNFKLKKSLCNPNNPRCCFRKTYAVMGGFENRQVIEWLRKGELNERIYSIAVRVKKEDVLDLPPQIHTGRSFELPGKARKVYDDLEEDFYAEHADGEVTPANSLVKLLRLHQVASGHVGLDDGRVEIVHDAKEELLTDMLADFEPGEPIVVFYKFKPDALAIRRAAIKAGWTYGEVSGDRDDTINAKFADNVDLLAAQVRAGSEGLDFTRSAYAIFFSVGFSLAEFQQCLARPHRGGQTRPVTYYHLAATNTVEPRIYYALEKRRDLVESVLTQMRSRIAS